VSSIGLPPGVELVEKGPLAIAASLARRRARRQFDRPRFLWLVSGLAMLFLLLPIVVVVLYSLNSRSSLVTFGGFSLHWYHQALSDGGLRSSLWASLEIGLITTAVCAITGTLLAFGLQRGYRPAAAASDGALILRLVSPETATAVAALLLFTQLGVTLSRTTIVLAHIALLLPYVTVIVRSRLAGVNPEVEEAAMDLGATRGGALRLTVLPLLWPSIAASSMLVFVMSFDDFVTTYFTSGVGISPLPVRIYSMLRFGVTPVVNAIGVLMMIIALLAALCAVVLMRVTRRRTALAPSLRLEGATS
jgi:ABC-type spermidine/putrescine transport system permease subunit II